MSRPTLALLDASGYLYRAFHAIRGLTGPSGRPTNATFGFATMLQKLLRDRKPDAVAVVFDRPERTFRHEMDPTYKATRQAMPDELVPQVTDTKKLCRAMGLRVVEEPGFEADDLIGTLADRAARAGIGVEVVSSDKDLFQLVDGEHVVVWHPVKEVLLDPAGVKEQFGVPPERVVDVLALMGDSADNIPGVAGIGEKGARELVNAYGPLEEVYRHLDEVKGKRREALAAGREDAFRSRELATVRRDAPAPGGETPDTLLETFRPAPRDAGRVAELASLYEELGFSRLKRELLEEAGAAAPVEAAPAPAAEAARDGEAGVEWAEGGAALAGLASRARAAVRVGLHVECAPGRPFPPEPLAAAVALPDGVVAVPLAGPGAKAGREALGALLADGRVTVVAHDVKRVFLAASALGLPVPARFEDPMLAAYVEAPGLFAHDLAGDARALLDLPPEKVPTPKDVTGAAQFDSATPLETDAGRTYLAARARLPLALAGALEARLSGGAGEAKRRVLDEIELPLVPVLARMEATGVLVDRDVLASLSREFEGRLLDLETRIVEAAGESFNVGSPQQLGRILFEKLGYTATKLTAKTKSYATGSDVLEELAAQGLSPVPGLVLEWREISKLKGTYVDALPQHVAADGRIHTRFDQAVAATGRLSSNDPNLQNIPVRTEAGRAIRRAFVAPPGRLLVSADYSQVELRLLAHLSGDEALVEVFRRGEDIHRATAAKIFGVHPDLVSPDQRRGAKTINFGILYGMGPFALAGQLGVPQSEAKAFIKAYFDRFPKIRACLDGILARARETGGTETIFGRVRPIPGLTDRNHAVRSNAERMAMNAPFQGSAADLIKRAMVGLQGALDASGTSARLLLQVHDELVLECDEADADRVAALAREAMEGAAALAVPLTVEVGRGRNWADAK
ncbi:MAG: DNA polymerase I [Acidobacteria bacterium]|nr:MAG: DNA polymerase I [Acidobacteriota bacterium]